MYRLLTDDVLWSELKKRAKVAEVRKAAVAYFTGGSGVNFRKGDTLVVDASDHTIKSAGTSAKALGVAQRAGVRLHSCAGLHAKVMIFDNVVFIGSANLSSSSQSTLRETGVLTDNQKLLSSARSYIDALTKQSQPIDAAFVRRVAKLPVPKRPQRPGIKHSKALDLDESTVWLVSVHEGPDRADARYEKAVAKAEEDAVTLLSNQESDIDHFWWRGKAAPILRARPGDTIIWLLHDRVTKDWIRVYEPITLLSKRRIGQRTYFFCETPASPRTVRWSTFETWASSAGVSRLGTATNRQLSAVAADVLLAKWSGRL